MASEIEQLMNKLRLDIKNDAEESLKKVENRITSSITELIDSKFRTIEQGISTIKNLSEENEKRLTEIEKHIRCRNIVLFGIKEEEKSYEDLEKHISQVIVSQLKLNCDKNDIQIVKRLGKKIENKIRPVVVTLNTYSKKLSILKNKHYLKDSSIYLKEDFPPKILQIRKKLQLQVEEERKKGKVAYLRYDRIIIKDSTPSKSKENHSTIQKKKRELEVTPPNEVSTQSASERYHKAKKNKPKPYTTQNSQTSIKKYISQPRETSTAEDQLERLLSPDFNLNLEQQ